MFKKITAPIVAMAVALIPIFAWAEAELYIPPPAPAPAPSTINRGSNVGQASQQGGAGANNAAGAALIAAGTPLLAQPPTAPMGAMLIALGMMALAQGGHDSGAADQSANTGAASVFQNGPPTQANQAEKGATSFLSPEAKKGIAAIKEMGYEVSKAGIKLPDGSTIPTSSLSSPGAMAAAGIDPSVIAKLDEINKEISQKYSVSGMPVAAGGGGGGAGGNAEDVSGANGAAAAEYGGSGFSLFDANAAKNAIAGKTLNLDGDPIGVAGANIFDMIHTAYQKKRTGEQFMEGEDAAAIRTPAATKRKAR